MLPTSSDAHLRPPEAAARELVAPATPRDPLGPIGPERLFALREAIRSGHYPAEGDVLSGLARLLRVSP